MTMLEGQVALAFAGMMAAVLAAGVIGQRWANRRERLAKKAEQKRPDPGTVFDSEMPGVFRELSGP